MTIEKAIDRLRKISEKTPIRTNGDDLVAITMAIQALSQEPCEDAVSRDAVLSIIDGWYEQNRETENIEDLIILITYMDSVTQKSGKWEDLHRCWVCSECGQQTHIEHKYCPNCGAKMESEE